MAKASWPEEVKQRALALYLEGGVASASAATGVPRGTIASWASRACLVDQQQANTNRSTAAAVERRTRAVEERREVLVAKLGELAELGVDWALERVADPKAEVSLRDVIGAMTRAIHDLQLLSGAATSRPDLSSLSAEERAERVASKFDELAERRQRVEGEEAARAADAGERSA